MDVSIKWLPRKKEGLQYAVLRWRSEGERSQETLGFVTPAQAEQSRRERIAKLTLKLDSPASTVVAYTVDDLVVSYLGAIERDQRGSELYRRHELLHCTKIGRHLGGRVADDLTSADLRQFVHDLKNAVPPEGERGVKRKRSFTSVLGAFHRVMKHGHEQGLNKRLLPPLPRNTLPYDARPPRQLTEDEVRRLIAGATAIRPAFGRLLQFLAWCPRRPVAVFAIARKHCERVSLDPSQVYIERDKGGIGRGWCPLTPPAQQALVEQLANEWAEPDVPVWTAPMGGPWNASSLTSAMRPLLRDVELDDVHPYDLRKFGASTIYRLTGSLHVTAKFTGHGDVRTLLTHYVSEQAGAVERAAPTLTWSDS